MTDEKTAGEKSAQGESTTSSLFGAFGKRHYEGGFDDKMSRREAALILGVRESAAPQRIKVKSRGDGLRVVCIIVNELGQGKLCFTHLWCR